MLFRSIIIVTEGLTTIENNTFDSCDYLRDVSLPKSVKTIKNNAFYNCKTLASISFPEGVLTIENVFSGCEWLKNIYLPKSLTTYNDTEIKNANFYYEGSYEEWKKIEAGNVTYWNKSGNRLYIKDKQGKYVIKKRYKTETANNNQQSSTGGCYVATCVYGSYDCPQVWTLRRYRDNTLDSTWYGRAFIRVYYAISPTLVKWFGKTKWFKKMWKGKLDRMVKKLNEQGVENTPYQDKIY